MGNTASRKRSLEYDKNHNQEDMFYWFVAIDAEVNMRDKLGVVSAFQKHRLTFTQRTSGCEFNVYASVKQMKKLFKACKSISTAVEISRRQFRVHF